MAAVSLAVLCRNYEADGAAPWQRAPLLDHVKVTAVRAAWLESWPWLRAPHGGDPAPSVRLYAYLHIIVRKCKESFTVMYYPNRV